MRKSRIFFKYVYSFQISVYWKDIISRILLQVSKMSKLQTFLKLQILKNTNQVGQLISNGVIHASTETSHSSDWNHHTLTKQCGIKEKSRKRICLFRPSRSSSVYLPCIKKTKSLIVTDTSHRSDWNHHTLENVV